jgi:hypothetical protein
VRATQERLAQDLTARLDGVEGTLRGEIERAGNTLTAYFAELEDRLNRGERPAPPGSSA